MEDETESDEVIYRSILSGRLEQLGEGWASHTIYATQSDGTVACVVELMIKPMQGGSLLDTYRYVQSVLSSTVMSLEGMLAFTAIPIPQE